MDQTAIIRDLLVWLESHLDYQLNLNNVAARAGYSKWHLQRMFKEVTGQAIGAYIRARRLSKAAIALRLTSRSILDIALQYRFDSQQTFTRAFKKQFCQTPAWYRRSPEWNAFGLRSPIRLDPPPLPEPEWVNLPEITLLGHTQSYSYTLEKLSMFRDEVRVNFWQQFLSNAVNVPSVLYGLQQTSLCPESDDGQEILYTTAILAEEVSEEVAPDQTVVIKGGDYVQFTYSGHRNGLQEFILTLYSVCMPKLQLIRREGQDIERFYTHGGKKLPHPPEMVRCEYLIPIRRQSENKVA